MKRQRVRKPNDVIFLPTYEKHRANETNIFRHNKIEENYPKLNKNKYILVHTHILVFFFSTSIHLFTLKYNVVLGH